MMMKLRQLWESRAPRERKIIILVAALVGAVLYGWLVHTADVARTHLRTSVTTFRALAARVEHEAAEYESLRSKTPATPSKTELRALVQAQIDAQGLGRSTTRIEATSPNDVQVVFGAVPFADWLKWVTSLQSQQVRLDTCRIETLSTPGLVSVTATVTRAKPQ